MWSPNKRRPSADEARYLAAVKHLPCSVCDAPGPSELHEPRQGSWWLVVALCPDCHRGSHNGIGRGIWRVKKMDQWDALAVTIRRVTGISVGGVTPADGVSA